jgi:leader peptidase (prepilin peptidase)/N-methyltransferase
MLGSIVGLALIASGRGGRKTALPFGPFMVAGALVGVFVAEALATWYTGLLI